MKTKLLLVVLVALSCQAAEVEKKGFLTSKWCAQNGYFSDCRLESLVCGSGDCFKEWTFEQKIKEEIVLFVHDENKAYAVDYSAIPRYELDQPMNRNGVSISGELKGDTLVLKTFKAPPPPVKSFFKGCL